MPINNKKMHPGWTLVFVLALVPAVLWLLAPPLIPRFSSFAIGMSNIGQLFGLIGAAMFATNLLLSTRLKLVEDLFHGLNRVYHRHGQLGQFALILLLFHPLMLLPKYAGNSFSQAALFLLPSTNWPQTYGWLALTGMILLVVATLYIPLKYNFWKGTHKFFGLAFFLASLHIWFIPSDVSHYLPLRAYMLTLSGAGLAAYTYHTLLGKFLVKRFRYVVRAVNQLGDNVINIVMAPLGQRLNFTPGQYVFISFGDATVSRESHPFSITSGLNEKTLSITAKNLGDYTSKLKTLAVGATAEIEGPFGIFSYANASGKKQIWIAGGIGITPFISMAKSLRTGANYKIDLFYCLKNEGEAVYLNELTALAETLNSGLKIIPFYSDRQGYIDATKIENRVGKLTDQEILICAPPLMITALKEQLATKGVNKKLIHSEEFNL